MKVLEVRELTVSYGAVEAVRGVNLQLGEGEVVCLIGANGAGKSTTLLAISGILRPTRGDILLGGNSVLGVPAHEIVRLGIAQVPEGRRIFPRLTVGENLWMGGFGRTAEEIEEKREEVYGLFPVLRDRQNQLGETLSGGEQQMLAIGRALMARPGILLLDEPSLGLAPKVVHQIFDLIGRIRKRGISILLVEQNAHMALGIADRGYVLETGQVVLEGKSKELLLDQRVRQAYLGES